MNARPLRPGTIFITAALLVALTAAAGIDGNAGAGARAASLGPSGTAAFFLRGNGRRYVALTSLAGGKTRVRALPPAAAKDDVEELQMDFSQEGRTVSFLAGGSFFVVDAQTARLQRTFSSLKLGHGADGASLSPDGRRVAVIHNGFGCSSNVWISVVAEYAAPRRIALPAAIRPSARRGIEIRGIVWAPDGRSITINVAQYDDPLDCRTSTISSAFLFRLSVTGKGHAKLREATDFLFTPRWAPDGSLLGYIEGNMYNWSDSDVFVVRPDGSRRRRLTHFGSGQGGDQGVSFAWSRTGHLVVAHVRGNGRRGDVGLFDVDPRSGVNRRFSQFESESVLAVSLDGRLVAVAGLPDVVVLSVADGKIRRRTSLTSPRSGLRVEDYSPVAVSFSP
jgi:Tol biopolymer transport system component